MPNEIHAAFDTTEGNFKVRLFAEEVPRTVQNFTDLAEGKRPACRFMTARCSIA